MPGGEDASTLRLKPNRHYFDQPVMEIFKELKKKLLAYGCNLEGIIFLKMDKKAIVMPLFRKIIT